MSRILLALVPDYMAELEKRLARLGVQWVELARETGVEQTQMSRWKNKAMQPSWPNIVKLEQGLERIKRRRGLTE